MMRVLRRILASLLRRAANLLSPADRPPFNTGELEQVLRHLAYERLLFEHCRSEWRKNRQRPILEAFLLHARNLRDFLFGRLEEYGRDADKAVIATDYAPTWNSDKGNHAYQVLWNTDQAINAQLAHLSRRRADPQAQRKLDNEAENLGSAIAKAWDLFRGALSSTPWASELDAAIAEKEAELGLS